LTKLADDVAGRGVGGLPYEAVDDRYAVFVGRCTETKASYVVKNEHLDPVVKKRVGYFQLHDGDWYLVNEGMPGMKDVIAGKEIQIGGNVKLEEGTQVLLSPVEGGRLIQVQMAGA
jgi:hypothetical protein